MKTEGPCLTYTAPGYRKFRVNLEEKLNLESSGSAGSQIMSPKYATYQTETPWPARGQTTQVRPAVRAAHGLHCLVLKAPHFLRKCGAPVCVRNI